MAILRVFQQEGRIGKKERRNKTANVVETFSFYYVTDHNIQQIGEVNIQESKISYKRD